MISPHDAFLLGYTPMLVGIYFNGVELLATAGHGATGALAKRVAERAAAFSARKPGIIDNVRLVEQLLPRAGVAVPPPPRLPAEFHPWSQDLFQQAHHALAGAQDAQPAAAHLLGFVLGDAMLTLNVAVLVHDLLDADPEHAWLQAQAAALADQHDKIRRQLTQAEALPALPEATRAAALKAREIWSQAAAGSTRQLDDLLRRLGDTVTAVERSLH